MQYRRNERALSAARNSQLHTVIVTPELIGPHKNGGIGTFATNWAYILRQAGNDVSVVYTSPIGVDAAHWQHLYHDRSIMVFHAMEDEQALPFEGPWFTRRSERAAAAIPADADVVYFQDWSANGFHFLRNRQFRTDRSPACVMVAHSSHEWVLDASRSAPNSALDVAESFAERYALEHSDFVVLPASICSTTSPAVNGNYHTRTACECLDIPYLKTSWSRETRSPVRRLCTAHLFWPP